MTVAAEEATVASAGPETKSLTQMFYEIKAEHEAAASGKTEEPAKSAKPAKVKAESKTNESVPETEATSSEEPAKPAVSLDERTRFREDKRKLKEREAAIAQREAQLNQRAQQLEATSPDKLKGLIDAGRFDEAAQVYGFKTWNEMNDHAIRTFASPEYKRVREVEARLAAKEEADRQAAERVMAQNRSAAQRQAQQEYITALGEELGNCDDPTIKGLSEDPDFIHAVFGHIVRHAQENDGEEMDFLEAAKEVEKTASKRFEILHKVYGGQPASKVESASHAATSREKGKKHVTRATSSEASPPVAFKTEAEFLKFGAEEMRKAAEVEYQEKQKAKRAS